MKQFMNFIRQRFKLSLFIILPLCLASCSSDKTYDEQEDTDPSIVSSGNNNLLPKGNIGRYKVGKPYKIKGKWYYPKVEEDSFTEVGVASWYGPGFHGKKTANGEKYNQNLLTAAHRTLPLPTYVKVTNLDNNRQITVRVNDRGPFAKNRVIDLSKKAAEVLGFKNKGTTKVKVQIVKEEDLNKPKKVAKKPVTSQPKNIALKPQSPAPLANTQKAAPIEVSALEPVSSTAFAATDPHFIQVGSFSNYWNASNLKETLADYGQIKIHEINLGKNTFYRVQMGPFKSLSETETIQKTLIEIGHEDAKIIPKIKSKI